jgi:plastocyanin
MATVRWSAVVVLVMAVTGAACASETSAGSGGGIYGGSPSSSGSETSPMPTSGGGGYGTGGGGGGGGGGGKSVATVGQSNYVFTPSKPKVASGDTITIKNSTPSTPHTFTVDGENIDVAVDPGSSQDVKIGLAAGTYDFHCRYHESQGMVGTLTVT